MNACRPKIVKAMISGTGYPLDGHEVYLAEWSYDPGCWHLFNWEKEADAAVMLTIYQTETEAGICASESFSEFMAVWEAGEYEADCVFRIDKENAQVLDKVYAVHFTRQNKLLKVINEKTAEVLKKFGGSMVPCKDANLYLGSFVFRTPEQRDEFCRVCDDLGIYFTVETESAYIPAEDLPEEWRNEG